MTFETLHNTIRDRFKDEVETPLGVKVVYDNAPDEHPDDARWIEVGVRPAVTSQADSAPTYRTVGNVVATVFQPIEQGDKGALEHVDVIVAAFRGLTASGVKFRVPSVNVLGREGPEGKWWRVQVVCPFQCDEVNP